MFRANISHMAKTKHSEVTNVLISLSIYVNADTYLLMTTTFCELKQ